MKNAENFCTHDILLSDILIIEMKKVWLKNTVQTVPMLMFSTCKIFGRSEAVIY